MSLVSGVTTSFEFVGEGEFPVELDRVNWGAYWLTLLWALFDGFWGWVLGIVGLTIVLENLVWFGLDAIGREVPIQLVIDRFGTVQSVMLWVASVFLAVRGNRLVWEAHRKRLAGARGDGDLPKPAWRWVSTQRRWAVVGLVLGVSGIVGTIGYLAFYVRSTNLADWTGVALAVVTPLALLVYDRSRHRTARS